MKEITASEFYIDATQQKYNAIIERYIHSGRFLPACEHDVLEYLQELGALNRVDRLKVSSLKVHLGALKKWHVQGRWDDPTNSLSIRNYLKQLKSLERQNGIEKDSSRFITAEECLQLVSLLIVMTDNLKAKRDRLVAAISLVTGHRPGMVASIKVEHIMNLGVAGAHIIIDTPAFKTQAQTPTFIPYTGAEFCPATWLRGFIDEQGLTEGYIFKGVQQDFKKPLSVQTLNAIVKDIFVSAGIKGGKLTSYTFRKTMPTLAAMEGVHAADIAAQGSWSSTETVNKHYISKAIGLLGKAPLAVLTSISKVSDALALPVENLNQITHDQITDPSDDFHFAHLNQAITLTPSEAKALHASLELYLNKTRT